MIYEMKRTVGMAVNWSYPGHSQAFISEFLALLEKTDDRDFKIEMMKEYAAALRTSNKKAQTWFFVLECIFTNKHNFALPKGLPDSIRGFSRLPDHAPNHLFNILNKAHYLLENSKTIAPLPKKRELIFLQMIEGYNEAEAMVLLAMKDKKPAYVPGITYDLIEAAYPGFLPKRGDSEAKKETSMTNPTTPVTVDQSQPIKVRKKPGPKPGFKRKSKVSGEESSESKSRIG